MNQKDKFIIIDANAVLHRAWHALPPLETESGQVVNAVYGFISVIIKILREFKPNYMAACFDMPGPTFRHKEFKEYKAGREKQPDEFYEQIPITQGVLKDFDIQVLGLSGYEADDLIGFLSHKVDGGLEKIIVTGDMDALQLVDKSTWVYNLKKGISETEIFDEAAVFERYGFKPEQLIDYKALRGDPSDNIPGVRGIGKKTATQLIQQFSSLEVLYQQVEQGEVGGVSQRIRQMLLDQKDQAFLSKKLATIVLDVPLDFNLENFKTKKLDVDKISVKFSQLGFKSLLKRLDDVVGIKQEKLI
jgi:DNA polymerase-1